MCGICGVLTFDGAPIDPLRLDTMRDTLTHRGPDDCGSWIGDGVGLAMRRLSIIDLATGHQPIWNEDRTVGIVFNGEIYNYRELRARLIAAGHALETHSDTEVIVHLYEDHGEECIGLLDGMFAFAIWDARRGRLLVARDRLGEKPLIYCLTDRQLVFGSELKAVTAAGVPREIDPAALYHYLTTMSVPAPHTVFRGIQKLQPGHYLTCDRHGRSEIRKYWDVDRWEPESAKSEADRRDELATRFERSVQQRLISDVPVGALLSGGIDSSLVVAVATQVLQAPVKTFTVGFADAARADERAYARQVASHFGTEHHEIVVTPNLYDLLPKLVWFWDEPFAVSSAVPTYLVCKFAREHVKVVLTGDGGDELFAGYPRYRWDRWADRLGTLGAFGARLAMPLSAAARSSSARLRRAHRYAQSLQMSADVRYAFYLSKIDAGEKRSLVSADWLRRFDDAGLRDSDVTDGAYAVFRGRDALNRRLYGDLKTSLADEMLAKVDRMSMAASLEARPPLLDHRLVEFVATLPPGDKLRGSTSKYLLRRLAADRLPASILNRPKHGFDVPIGAWMRGSLRGFVEDILFSTRAAQRGIWQPAAVRAMWDRHQRGESGLADKLWILLNLELWGQVVYDAAPPKLRVTA